MWRRAAMVRLRSLWRQFPAVLIVGARQVGKTTLARQAFPRLPYCDLEEPRLRDLFKSDPTFQVESRATTSLILDEAQCVPEVFASLRGLIDRQRRKNGRFLILGSAQPSLLREASETLAGRIGVMELDPLTTSETGSPPRRSWQQVWLQGGFPEALRGKFRDWWEAYLRTYVERDLPHLGVAADPLLVRRLLTMLAHAQGGLLNASQLGQSLSTSYHTVQRYLDILERTFLIRRLPPYSRNVGKRLTKAPKLYVRDTGLVHHLLNINSLTELESHPVHGASWETFVIEEIIRRERLKNPHTQYFFWRTATGVEADLILDRGSERVAIEIKAGRGDRPETVRGLASIVADTGARSAWILDQAAGTDPLVRGVTRRAYPESLDWLP
jgi:hypothetical protein